MLKKAQNLANGEVKYKNIYAKNRKNGQHDDEKSKNQSEYDIERSQIVSGVHFSMFKMHNDSQSPKLSDLTLFLQ